MEFLIVSSYDVLILNFGSVAKILIKSPINGREANISMLPLLD